MVVLWTLGLSITSCNKNQQFLEQGGQIAFSTDTILFDTAFSSMKSSTHLVKVYNKESQFLRLDLFLEKGVNASYDITVDGKTGKKVSDIEIAGNDSALVFITMNVDPTDEGIPFIVEDYLVASYNGLSNKIPIVGYAQNAYYINDSVLTTTTLLTDKPYVIINSALVATGETLTIPAGVTVYFHRNSRLYVQGTLKVMGTLSDQVRMQSDRIDRRIYVGSDDDVPGEWGGIYFLPESHDNEIHHATIKNGGLSTQVGGGSTLPAVIQLDKDTRMDGTPKLRMTNTIIKNAVAYGIIAFESSINAENCLIMNCQDINVALLQGGNYLFNDCTIGTMGGIRFFGRSLNAVSVVTQNYYQLTETTFNTADLNVQFNNCIIYGTNEEEFIANKRDGFAANVSLNYCLLKHTDPISDFVTLSNMMYNIDPAFVDISKSDFNLSTSSPVINKGTAAGTIPTDYNGVTRPATPSIGAMEPQP